MNITKRSNFCSGAAGVLGFMLVPLIWVMLKYCANVSDRYLPTPAAVLGAFQDIEPNICVHFAYTAARLILGLFGGVAAGIALGIAYLAQTSKQAR